MFKQKRLTVLSLAVMLALLMAAVLPMSALADDGIPPQPETPVVEEPVVEVPAAEEPTVAEVLAEVPAGTDVVVLDENGEALPLASAEAADAILVSDPMWCPVGTTIVTAAVCENDLTVAGLLAKLLAAGKNADGVIYFMSTYTTDDAYFDAADANLANLKDNALTLQGGWNGVTTDGSTITYAGNSVFSNPVAVIDWLGNITLNNIAITGVNTNNNEALYVTTTKDVVLNNVSVSNNTVDADANTADSVSGANIYADGAVTVNNSQFDNNKSAGTSDGKMAGLNISSNLNSAMGEVTLNNVSASYNKGDGADIYGASKVTVSNSVFNFNTSDAKNSAGDPWGNGLWMDKITGDITLNNVSAMYNSYNGVEVGSKSNEGKSGNGTTGNIIVNGGNFQYNGFGKNGGDGLHLNADKNITLNGVRAWGNYDDGAEVCAGGDVNLNGNMFYYNGYGVYLRCAKNVNSSYNYWWNYWYSSYWDNWYGNYYGSGDYYYSGYYDGFYYNGWALPTWGGPYITINNIYVDGYFLPNYNSYYSFYNSYYGRFWDWGYNERGHGWRWWGWNWGWLYRGSPFQGVVTTKPMTAELTPLTEDKLPGKLPEGKTFTDAFEAKVSDGVPGEVTKVFFEVPAGFADGDTLTVLSWNEKTETWDEVESTVEDGKVNFKTGTSGTFALVTP